MPSPIAPSKTPRRIAQVHPGGELPLGPATPSPRKKVIIVGGGIAGLTVAHELARTTNFDIHLYEQNSDLGGKARSQRNADHNPTEHAMRVLLASYTCLYRIMSEVTTPDGQTLMANLTYPIFSFKYAGNQCDLNAECTSFHEYCTSSLRLLAFYLKCGVSYTEMAIFLYRIARIMWYTDSQVKAIMGRISFEEYMDVEERSPVFRATLLRVSEMLVAAKRTASAALVSRIILEWFVGPFLNSPYHRKGFASLNGPTSERLIDPWAQQLQNAGVTFHMNTPIVALAESAREITSLTTASGEVLTADYYCLCLPHLALDNLVQGRLSRFLPTINDLTTFGEEWSAGIQYFLREIPDRLKKLPGRIVVDVETAWSVVYMLHTNGAPWMKVPLPEGTVAVLSLVMSNGRNSGRFVTSKPFVRCRADEMKNEALAQIGLFDELQNVPYAIGPDLDYISAADYAATAASYDGYGVSKVDDQTIMVSDGLLYVRMPKNLDDEPANFTDIHNLFIAGEFTKTNFSIPTMEKSCESAMRCASAIYEASGINYDPARLTPAQLPFHFLRSPFFHLFAKIALLFLAIITVWLIARAAMPGK